MLVEKQPRMRMEGNAADVPVDPSGTGKCPRAGHLRHERAFCEQVAEMQQIRARETLQSCAAACSRGRCSAPHLQRTWSARPKARRLGGVAEPECLRKMLVVAFEMAAKEAGQRPSSTCDLLVLEGAKRRNVPATACPRQRVGRSLLHRAPRHGTQDGLAIPSWVEE
ncbi:hypothetical protein PSPO01_00150 [Paraphaeosphaeria sporulosa]